MTNCGIRVFRRHLAAADICARGSRVWFEQYKIDYMNYLKKGVPVEIMEATGDHFALLVSRLAREEAAKKEVKNGQ